jgi:hypothetical protein
MGKELKVRVMEKGRKTFRDFLTRPVDSWGLSINIVGYDFGALVVVRRSDSSDTGLDRT